MTIPYRNFGDERTDGQTDLTASGYTALACNASPVVRKFDNASTAATQSKETHPLSM